MTMGSWCSAVALILVTQAAMLSALPSGPADIPLLLTNSTVNNPRPATDLSNISIANLTTRPSSRSRHADMWKAFEDGMREPLKDPEYGPLALAIYKVPLWLDKYSFLLVTDPDVHSERCMTDRYKMDATWERWYQGPSVQIAPLKSIGKVDWEAFKNPVITYEDAITLSEDFCEEYNCRTYLGLWSPEKYTCWMVNLILKDKADLDVKPQPYYAFRSKYTDDVLLISLRGDLHLIELAERWPPLCIDADD